MKVSLEVLLEKSKEQKILFLGRESLFTHKEAQRYLKKYGLILTTRLEEGVVAVVEHHRLNPVEEDISYMAYDQNIPLYKLEEFERLISHTLVDDQVLMGLKLSQDQKRLHTLIMNEHISDALFIRLLEMYKWSEDEDEDDNEDRGVVISTLRRFLDFKPNEEDLLYSSLTLKKLISQCSDFTLLYALLSFPNFRFMQKGKQWITLRETIATSSALDERTIEKLLRFREERVYFYLAANRIVPLKILKKLFERDSEDIYEALASNKAIDRELFVALLSRDEGVRRVLLSYQSIDRDYFEMIETVQLPIDDYLFLGQNEQIDKEVISKLIEKGDDQILQVLARNTILSETLLTELYQRHNSLLYPSLALNTSTPKSILEELFQNNKEDAVLLRALAGNPSTPLAILQELFERDIFEINEKLATNESLPIEFLNVLKIDTRLRNALTGNKA